MTMEDIIAEARAQFARDEEERIAQSTKEKEFHKALKAIDQAIELMDQARDYYLSALIDYAETPEKREAMLDAENYEAMFDVWYNAINPIKERREVVYRALLDIESARQDERRKARQAEHDQA